MAYRRKQIAFDLLTESLKAYYPRLHWKSAYDDIRKHMEVNGFIWQQGSVYVSEKPMSAAQVVKIIEALIAKCPWINYCMCDCRMTNIGKEHSLNKFFESASVNLVMKRKTREKCNPEKEHKIQI